MSMWQHGVVSMGGAPAAVLGLLVAALSPLACAAGSIDEDNAYFRKIMVPIIEDAKGRDIAKRCQKRYDARALSQYESWTGGQYDVFVHPYKQLDLYITSEMKVKDAKVAAQVKAALLDRVERGAVQYNDRLGRDRVLLRCRNFLSYIAYVESSARGKPYDFDGLMRVVPY
ncbi:MAG: hypothetical protein JNM11_00620 [Chitinimonas sp.]|nr:hypothetical protein [Chitinimonas sp.]